MLTFVPSPRRCSCSRTVSHGEFVSRTLALAKFTCEKIILAPETSVAGSRRAERLEDRGSDGTSDCRTVSRHTVPVTSHPRVRGTHPVYRPHPPVPGQEERDSGAGSHGEPAPKGSFPPARYYGWGKKVVPATLA
jgi:hypothetical protein